MPCGPTVENGKVTGWLHIPPRTKQKPPPCYKCGKPSTKLCDFRECGIRHHKDEYGRERKTDWHSIDTCDLPMCDECANHVGEDTDYCDKHYNEFDMKKASRAERLYQEQLRQFGMSEED